MSQNKDDDFLSDLEEELGGDWKEIQKSIQDKEQEEQLKANPQRFMFPNFQEFYELLLRLFKEHRHESRDLHRLLISVFHSHRNEDPMPKAFDKVWEIFCNPHEYECATGIACRNCKSRWDVMFSRDQVRRIPQFLEDRMAEMYMEQTRVLCPKCGVQILNLATSEVVGVFKHVHVDEKEEYRPNRSYMGERGYDRVISEFESNF